MSKIIRLIALPACALLRGVEGSSSMEHPKPGHDHSATGLRSSASGQKMSGQTLRHRGDNDDVFDPEDVSVEPGKVDSGSTLVAPSKIHERPSVQQIPRDHGKTSYGNQDPSKHVKASHQDTARGLMTPKKPSKNNNQSTLS
jgi:hypothetical protein